jgi:malate dehydrogenase (oxaloacetate-decarboxylating)
MEKMPLDLSPEQILNAPLLNKGSAFTQEEREELGLIGLLPYHVSTIEEQVQRRYQNFLSQPNELHKFVFLSSLQNRNEILFYRLVSEYVTEMLPYIYTPTVGDVSLQYSNLHRENRGLYLSYPQKDHMQKMVDQFKDRDIDVIVVTDGERILGLGDVGIGGMAIPIGKLSLYTLFGGIHPAKTLPVFLDVGTNNKELLNDVQYLGWRHERISGKEYDEFVDLFVQAVKKTYPRALLQWEDFGKEHARPLLERYREQILSFNDDIQGTAAVVLSAILAASKLDMVKIKDQKIAVLGGGSAGLGICHKLVDAMVEEGMDRNEAFKNFYVVDKDGLIHSEIRSDEAQRVFAQDIQQIKHWSVKDRQHISLLDVIKNARPSILIGVSTQGGAFTEEIVKTMVQYCARPVILPLSNPNSKSEAQPKDLIRWTHGKAIIATGSPFPAVEFQGKLHKIAQCNNVFIFPGVGLGVIAAKATQVTERMFVKAAQVLSDHAPLLKDPTASLFPAFEDLRAISKEIALNVGKIAIEEGIAQVTSYEALLKAIDQAMWQPNYPIFSRLKKK